MIREYYQLVKPGVLYGNVLTVVAGFLFASRGDVNSWVFFCATVGMTLVIASACALNNFLDRDIDARMERTKKRPSVSGSISGRSMVIYSIALGVLGLIILSLWTNWFVVAVAVIGYIDYVWLYGALSKRRSVHGTLVGSISGAAPILAGYLAASGSFDIGAIVVFTIIFLWQQPEFYSIAIFRRKEYKAANVPVISVVKGIIETKRQIFAYIFAFVVSTLLLPVFGYAGLIYTIAMTALGAYWIWLGFKGLKSQNDNDWSRRNFHFSLVILLVFCGLISVENFLP